VLAGVLVWHFVPNEPGGDISAPTQTGPVKTVERVRQVAVTAQRRAAIDATFAKFVPLAMGRRNPAAVRDYVTANLWSQAPPADWRSGTIPVPPFVAKPPYAGWRPIYSYPRVMSVELTLQPKLPKDPVTSFSVTLKLAEGKWLVDGIYQLGTHGGVAATQPTPSAPVTTSQEVSDVDNGFKGRLGFVWILVPLCLLSLIVIIPAVVFTHHWLSDRRVMRRHRNELSKELPTLPRPDGSARKPTEPDRVSRIE
jgi:hypothetical protein